MYFFHKTKIYKRNYKLYVFCARDKSYEKKE